jgi:hypothetical protein
VSNFCEGGTKFLLDFAKLLLDFLELFSMHVIPSSDLSPEFDEFFHQIADIEVVALGRGVVRRCYVRLGF